MTNTTYNLDCIRDCIIAIHKQFETSYNNSNLDLPPKFSWSVIYTNDTLLNKYDEKTIKCSIYNLLLLGYIESKDFNRLSNGNVTRFHIDHITPDGYNFLSISDNDKIWEKAKKEMSKQINSYDIKMLIPILSSLMGALATKVLSGV